jgi:glucose-1-phosphatase
MVSEDIQVVLFDIGGVLVELTGVETLRGWMQGRVTADELWQLWLSSPSVRAFETGRLEASVFAASIVEELGIAIGPEEFLEAFVSWPLGPYPGALELLERIPKRYRRALLSNSNALHWPRALEDLAAHSTFDACFVSHLTGKLKPDADAFQHVVDALGCSAEQVLFLDDNRLNIEAARAFGMHACLVRGVAEAHSALVEARVLPAFAKPGPV